MKGSVILAVGAALARAQEPAKENAPNIPGYGYRKPSFEVGSRVVFIGDLITDMKWGRNEKDRNHYLGHSYVFLIISRLGVDMPEARLDVYNRGHSGNKVSDLRKRWQKDAIDMKPELLSVMVGINDIGRGGAVESYEEDYRFILNDSREANPDLRLVLLDPFGLPVKRFANADAWKKRRAEIESFGAVVKRLADKFDAVHIRTQEVFDAAADIAPSEQWIWDGVHPLPQGHELIARAWLQAVSARWPVD